MQLSIQMFEILFIMHSLYIALTKPYIVAISKKKVIIPSALSLII